MRAVRLHAVGSWTSPRPPDLRFEDVPVPEPRASQVLLRVEVCGVCRTELDEIEGRLAPRMLPRVLGHQVVGHVVQRGPGVEQPADNQRVGVAWIFLACGQCEWCLSGSENLCPQFLATGYDVDGGYAEFMVAPAAFVHELPDDVDEARLAPLLCAGAIGYRSLQLTGLLEHAARGEALRLGLMGFGASAHLVLRMARATTPDLQVFVFARSSAERAFAEQLGASWTGNTTERAPAGLHAIIDTTPAHRPMLEALRNLLPGGKLVINAISKDKADLQALQDFDYHSDLWQERHVQSVANVTRRDVREFIALSSRCGFLPDVTEYPLEQAARALQELSEGHVRGAKVLRVATSEV